MTVVWAHSLILSSCHKKDSWKNKVDKAFKNIVNTINEDIEKG